MRRARAVLLSILIVLAVVGCTTREPLSGRKQFSLVSDAQVNQVGIKEYRVFLRKHRLSRDTAQVAMLRRVGRRIVAATERRFADDPVISARLREYRWEFNLVVDDAVNAFAMPGGKVAFYTGILPYTHDEDGLAVVMGHEIAHVVSGHHKERYSQALLAQGVGTVVNMATRNAAAAQRRAIQQVFGIGANVGYVMPMSRVQENHADRLGLILTALGGYDPHAGAAFWERMSKANKGKPPQWLSTHPSDEKRIERMKEEYIPEAMKYRVYVTDAGEEAMVVTRETP